MSSQIPRKYAFAKQGLLGLLSRLEGDVGDAAAADELAQTFSVALEMVHSAAADAEVDVAVDSEVTDCLNLARARLLPHASASWLEHSPHLVAGKEEEFRSVAVAPLAPLDVAGGYARLAEYRQQVEAGTMSRSEFEAHRSAILMADPGLGLPSSLAVSSPLLRLSMEPSPVGGGASPAVALSELFSNQTLHSPVVRAATAASSPSGFAATPSEAAAASIASGSQSRHRTAEPAPAADSVPPRGIKRGRDAPLMDVSQIPGYVRRKVKCAPFVGTAPPYPCSHCVSAGRECRRAATGRARGRPAAAVPSGAAPSGAAATSSLRLPASAFFAPEMPSSGVGLAATVMFWRGEIARTLAARRALDVQLSFAEWQYAHFLGALVEPEPPSSKPPRKRARTSSSRGPPRAPSTKGKEKAIDVDALSDGAGDAEAMDDAEDGASVGGDGADDGNGAGDAESSWTGFAASFGYALLVSVLWQFSFPLSLFVMPVLANDAVAADAPDEADRRAYVSAVTRLAVLAERWFGLRSRPEDVAGFLRDFYQALDHAEQLAVRLGLSGLTESARELRSIIEEAAAPHAELEWLLLFPGVFEEHRSWIIRYAAVFSRAQAVVIANFVSGRNIPPLRDPYILAVAEFRDMRADGVIELDELQWQEERLGRASLLAEIRRRESLGEAVLTNSG
ncbi:hypothetical protein EDB83DRAFT_2535549 [Lactarius deliciosus]|nr:hypothetical protein EDB83DRAFT_2535549 [Lactarius deliciosus]